MVKRLVPLVAVGVFGVSLLACGSNAVDLNDKAVYRRIATSSEFPFDCLYQASASVNPSLFRGGTLFAVVRDQADWQRLWEPALERGRQYPGTGCPEVDEPPLLDVDFEEEMVLLLLELQPSTGYSLKMDEIVIDDEEWVVKATRTTPCCGSFQEFEYLHRVVTTPRFDGDVTVVVTEVERPTPNSDQ